MANSAEAIETLREAFAQRTVDEWRGALADFIGQWTVVQDTLEAATDEQPAVPGRAPEFNEHGDAILAELGLDWDTVVDLEVRGVVA